MKPDDFGSWGWRMPFILSFVLFAISIYIRLKLQESPIFQRLKAPGKPPRRRIEDAFSSTRTKSTPLLALFGATAGQGVVWYTGQFYALFFLTITLKWTGDRVHADRPVAVIGTPSSSSSARCRTRSAA